MRNTLLLLFLTHFVIGQQAARPTTSKFLDFNFIKSIPVFELNAIDVDKLKLEDEEDLLNSIAPRIGFPHMVSIIPGNSGIWIEQAKGTLSWYLRIRCPEALSIALSFDKFYLPKSGKLIIRESVNGGIEHVFSTRNNKGSMHNPIGFTTPHIKGEEIILEYHQLSNEDKELISIFRVVHGYKSFHNDNLSNSKAQSFGSSGNCQVNVNCSEGTNWQDEKTSVALVLADGIRIGTGSLINNSCNDGELLFLTAEHILDVNGVGGLDYDAVSNPQLTHFTFYWGYESSGCPNPTSEPSIDFSYGAFLLANSNTADFALFRLTDGPYVDIIPAYKAYFNGWDRSSTTSTTSGVSIHHPRGDIKKISTFSGSPTVGTLTGYGGNYWVIGWTSTTNGYSIMEPGSSGAPLYNSSGKVMGQLHGGNSNCSNPATQLAYFGKISDSWSPSTNIKRQLKHWLDKCNTNTSQINGGYLSLCELVVNVDDPILLQNVMIRAEQTINASDYIGSTAEVEFKAGIDINLTNGFEVEEGAEFYAHIEDCEPKVITNSGKLADKNNLVQSRSEILENHFNIYPNPTKNTLNIEILNPGKGLVEINFINISGQSVGNYAMRSYDDENFSTVLNLEGIYSGLYILKIKSLNFNHTQRLIIE